jgi:hypothetical protein
VALRAIQTLRTLVEHGNDGSDDFQVTELLGGEVDEHILAARIILGEIPREITARRGQLSLPDRQAAPA